MAFSLGFGARRLWRRYVYLNPIYVFLLSSRPFDCLVLLPTDNAQIKELSHG